MSTTLFKITLLSLSLTATVAACNKKDFENKKTIRNLYKKYKNGSIEACSFEGKRVYIAGLNAFDAGSSIYDQDGNEIASCNFAWGMVDSMCHQLTDCEVIYRGKNAISGEPAVDKYNLKKLL